MRISDFRFQISDFQLRLDCGSERGQSEICNLKSEIPRPSPLVPRRWRRGFTLIEILVVVTVIAILAGMTFGAMRMARESAKEARTKATITKLNHALMQKYDSFATRRVPLNLAGLAPGDAAQLRLYAIRCLMRMEMPDTFDDMTKTPDTPVDLGTYGSTRYELPYSALARLYSQKWTTDTTGTTVKAGSAKCLYMLVMMGCPEAREMFSQNEIGVVDDAKWPVFVDGWGNPIKFLRWAPGFTQANNMPSGIQTGDANNDHDPFDSRGIESNAYKLTPLIYSAGSDGKYCINTDRNYQMPKLSPFTSTTTGGAGSDSDDNGATNGYFDNITNHLIEAK